MERKTTGGKKDVGESLRNNVWWSSIATKNTDLRQLPIMDTLLSSNPHLHTFPLDDTSLAADVADKRHDSSVTLD